ncbi:MAG TPA: 3-dehydroquinate synthase [Ktedonobacterales bacterium]
MNTHRATRIFLIGLSGSGKTTVGQLAADLLGWSFVDTDALVERMAGAPIPHIFAEYGESRFRELESAALGDVAARERVVIATGGGAVTSANNRERMWAAGWRVSLHVSPATALARVSESRGQPGAPERPMLAGDDPLARLEALLDARRDYYAEADETIHTDTLDARAVAARVVAGLVARGLVDGNGAEAHVRHIRYAPDAGYDAVVEWGGLARLGERLAALLVPPRLHIVSDTHVAALYGQLMVNNLREAGFDPALYTFAAGERSKSRVQLDVLHDWLAERRAERREAVVALGGGVVGDLAGFAAATYLRGVPLVQVPTSLLAQVDASVGGKVGIDHPRGKNLLGAFHQPRLVLADPAALLTLPSRTRAEGWAEVIKHGVALDASYFAALERDVDALRALAPKTTTSAVAGSVAIKAGVVEGDERERDDGMRHLLNYGHTIGHALETVTQYGEWLHGEAVAIGMAAAARIGQRLGLTPADVVARQDALLEAFGLPVRCPGVPAEALMRAALWDKKVRGGRVRWVLLTGLGSATGVTDIPDEIVRDALLDIGATADPVPEREE